MQIIIKNLSKLYKSADQTQLVLDDLSLNIETGSLTAICGKSGSGKSTLFRLIAGMDTEYSGSIELDGVNLSGMNDEERARLRRSKIALVEQDFNLIESLDVSENLSLPLLL